MEIKFRGKTKSGEWVYGSLIETTYNKTPQKWIVSSSKGNGGWLCIMQRKRVIPSTVGQYTGLHDKNGKEIYEGDRVRINWKGDPFNDEGIIEFINGCFKVCHLKNFLPLPLFLEYYKTEILGTIHDEVKP